MEFKVFSTKVENWDRKVILRYNGLGGKPITYILKALSFFGRETLWISLIAFYLFIRYDPYLLSNLSANFLVGVILIVPIKIIVNRSRPFDRIEKDKLKVLERKPSSKSFPSWHSYNIVAYGLLLSIFFLKSPIIILLMIIIAILVSFSRIQLGVHYPTDVIFGIFIGVIGFLLSIYIVAPFLQIIITSLEQFAIHEIEYKQINSMLFENIWYIVLCIGIFMFIFLTATFKIIKDKLKKNLEMI